VKKHSGKKSSDNATYTSSLGALIAGISGFPHIAVEDRGLSALAVDPRKLPIVVAVAKPAVDMCSSSTNVSKHSTDDVSLSTSPLVHIVLVVLAHGEAVDVDVALVGPRASPQLQRVVAE